MHKFLILSLFVLPLFSAEQSAVTTENDADLFLPPSMALHYLFDQAVSRYPNPMLDRSMAALPSSDSSRANQRMKRIYWENLAFHAANFNQKSKKL